MSYETTEIQHHPSAPAPPLDSSIAALYSNLQQAFSIVQDENLPISVEHVTNPVLIWRRRINLICCLILYISAPIVIITYGLILAKYITPLINIYEIGNWWTFLLLFGSCGIALIGSLPLLALHYQKFRLRYRHVICFDILLIVCWCALICVCIGAKETIQDRSSCWKSNVHCTKHWAPITQTTFGIYIDVVCRNESLSSGNSISETSILKDDAKCKATEILKLTIYTMYIWAVELFLVQMLDSVFGLGSFRAKDEPELISVLNKKKIDGSPGWGSQLGLVDSDNRY